MTLRTSLLVLLLGATLVRAQTLTIAAAVSLKESITAIGADFLQQTGTAVDFAFGGSGQLLAQLRSGAPIDVFVSAAPEQMNELQQEHLLQEGTRRDVATNSLVLIAPPRSSLSSVTQLPEEKVHRIAIGQKFTVPAGMYAEQSLRSMTLYDAVQAKLLLGSNVRQVLDYVITENADAGIVYATDAAQAGPKVRVVQVLPASTHEPIVYPAAVLKRSDHRVQAEAFLAFLVSPVAQQQLASHGFGPPPTTAPAHP